MDVIYSIDFTELLKESHYTGLIIFLIAFLETLLFVGFFFPGSTALMAIGGLIAAGYLDVWSTLFWATAGAIVGDNISFWIGVYFQVPLKKSRLYSKYHEQFVAGEQFFHKYGIYSVAVGRFVGPIRAVIPAIAGSMGMPAKVFFITNVISAVIWAPAYILSGMLIGKAISYYHEISQITSLELWSLIILIGLACWLIFLQLKRPINIRAESKRKVAYLVLFLVSVLFLGIILTATPD